VNQLVAWTLAYRASASPAPGGIVHHVGHVAKGLLALFAALESPEASSTSESDRAR
jgi:hypothetical protein